jgi:hypothetical protein
LRASASFKETVESEAFKQKAARVALTKKGSIMPQPSRIVPDCIHELQIAIIVHRPSLEARTTAHLKND